MTKAQELGRPGLGADLAAILTERDLFRARATERFIDEPDISERIEALWKGRRGKEAGSGVDPSALRAVERTATQLKRLMPDAREAGRSEAVDSDLIARLLLSSFPDRVCKRRDDGNGFIHVQGRGVRLSRDSHLGSSPYLIAVNVDAGEKTEGFIHMAAPVTEELIRSECRDRIETIRRVEWDRREGRIVAAVEERFGALLLSSRPFTPTDEEAAPLLCEIVGTTPGMLQFNKEAKQLQGRVLLVKKSFPEEEWPDLSDDHLFSKPGEWLLPWLMGVRSTRDLAALKVLPALKAKLSWEQQRLLDERAPVAIVVPSGNRVTLDYTEGAVPVLAVKLQELFGLADTPAIAGNRVKVLLHLLSPARRPVQITQDLKGFWNNAYQQVKKDLKGRYPRHPWPDDPWSAAPTRRTKNRER
jgi:ATP-dependent helicase HrpB